MDPHPDSAGEDAEPRRGGRAGGRDRARAAVLDGLRAPRPGRALLLPALPRPEPGHLADLLAERAGPRLPRSRRLVRRGLDHRRRPLGGLPVPRRGWLDPREDARAGPGRAGALRRELDPRIASRGRTAGAVDPRLLARALADGSLRVRAARP